MREGGVENVVEATPPAAEEANRATAAVKSADEAREMEVKFATDSDGLAAIVFDTPMTRADADLVPDTPLETILAHVEHVAERIGVRHVALVSDFDGAHHPDAYRRYASGLLAGPSDTTSIRAS